MGIELLFQKTFFFQLLEDVEIDGKPFRTYMSEKGIIVIDPMIIESCHGCFDLMTEYSKQMESLAKEGHKVVNLSQGGLLFG